MEIAACIQQTEKPESVVVIGMESVPFERVLGKEIGKLMQDLHESKGVKFRLNRTVRSLRGDTQRMVTGVELDDGEVLVADIVIIGAGIIPSSEFIANKLDPKLVARDGSLIVDQHLQLMPNVFVAGDLARFPYWATGEMIRIEHWDVAQQQGRIAATNMALGVKSNKITYHSVPFFWTMQFGISLRYTGNAMTWDRLVIKGELESKKFAAFYVKNNQVLACATMGFDPIAVIVSELLRDGTVPSVEELEDLPVNLLPAHLASASKKKSQKSNI